MLGAGRKDARYARPPQQLPVHALIRAPAAGATEQQESVDESTAAQEATLRAKLDATSDEAKRLAEGESLVFKASKYCLLLASLATCS